MVYNTPSKYRKGFGETLIADCDDALKHGRSANGVKIHDIQTFNQREYELIQMQSAIDNIATHTYIWCEAMRQHDGISEKQSVWLYNKEDNVGLKCEKIIKLIGGVKKYDEKTIEEIEKKNNSVR